MKTFLGGMVGGFLALLLIAGLASLSWYSIFEGLEEDTVELDEFDFDWTDQGLREIMLKVESYHRTFGFYPERLELAIGSTDSYDPLTKECECGVSRDFFYKVLADGVSYSLFSKGPDCKPFTQDDYHLKISYLEKPRLGITPNYNGVAAAETSTCKDQPTRPT